MVSRYSISRVLKDTIPIILTDKWRLFMMTRMNIEPLFFVSKTLSHRLAEGPIYCLGRAGMDLYPEPAGTNAEDAEHFSADMGGSAGNIAVALSRQGRHAALLTVFSDDQIGRFVLAKCKQYGVNTHYCRTKTGLCRNSLAIAETKPKNAAVVIYRNNAADLQLSQQDIERINFSRAGGLVVTGTAMSGEPSMSAVNFAILAARQAGCPIIIDIDYRANAWPGAATAARSMAPQLEQADILVGNDDEFALLGGGDKEKGFAVARAFAEAGQLVLYKRGELGCISLYQDQVIETGIFPVTPSKPFGAGDAFLGNFLVSLSLDRDIKAAVLQGSAAAAYVVARPGCASAMPDRQQLNDFMFFQEMTELNK